jgi:hypothetical protein
LQHCSSEANDRDAHPHNSPVHEGEFAAIVADMGKVEDIVGPFLRIGLKISWVRKKERGTRLTEAVRLHMAPEWTRISDSKSGLGLALVKRYHN